MTEQKALNLTVTGAKTAPAPAGAPKMETDGLSIYYGAFRAVAEVSMPVPDRKITAIIGPSGEGKSVLLKHLIGLLQPDLKVCIGNARLDGQRHRAIGKPAGIGIGLWRMRKPLPLGNGL